MRGATALVALVALVSGAAAAPDHRATGRDALPSDEAVAMEARRNELKARVEAVQRELAAAESSRADAADALKASALAISDAQRRLRDLKAERQRVAASLAGLDAERAALAEAVRAEQVLLVRLLARQQRGSEHDPLKLLLSGRDPGAIGRLLHYYQVISDARARAIASLRANLLRAQSLAESAAGEQQRLEALAEEETAQHAALERQRRQNAQVLASVVTDIRRQRRELDHLQRDEARLARLVDRLAGAAGAPAGAAPFHAAVAMPVRGELARRFGALSQTGGTASKGWFIRCAPGEEVRAIAAGQVVYADWLRGFGNLLILDHGAGYMSLYGNNDALLATVGATVRAGDAIAQAGASGGSAEPGLYFEIRHQGRAVDPAAWIGR